MRGFLTAFFGILTGALSNVGPVEASNPNYSSIGALYCRGANSSGVLYWDTDGVKNTSDSYDAVVYCPLVKDELDYGSAENSLVFVTATASGRVTAYLFQYDEEGVLSDWESVSASGSGAQQLEIGSVSAEPDGGYYMLVVILGPRWGATYNEFHAFLLKEGT